MSIQQPAELVETPKVTRSPSKTRHLSAMRLRLMESCVSLLQMSVNGKDKATKDAAITLALACAAEVKDIDDQIAKIQSA